MLRSRAPPSKHPLSIEEPVGDYKVLSSSTTTGQPVQPPAKASTSIPTINPAIAKSKDNPYTKSGVGKCYRCGKPGHRSNECPKRRPVNVAGYEEEYNVLIEIEPEDSDFAEKHGDLVTCVIQIVLCRQKIPDIIQRHQIFYSRCSVRIRFAVLSLTMKVARKSSLEYLWIS